jgi:hypothetical protein
MKINRNVDVNADADIEADMDTYLFTNIKMEHGMDTDG